MNHDIAKLKTPRCVDVAASGVNRANAVAELKPAIPSAHVWYNESGDGKQYATWSDYFAGSLSNRLYYLFHKHVGGKSSSRSLKWPGTDVDGKLVPSPEDVEVA